MKKHWLYIILLIFLLPFSCVLFSFGEEQVVISSATATQGIEHNEELEEDTPTVVPPSPTETLQPPTETPTLVPTEMVEIVPVEVFAFETQEGSPLLTLAWAHDCNWLGVAGQVFNQDGSPVNDLVVEAGGIIGGQPVLRLALTGRNSLYGEGGYELVLLDKPIDSAETVWIQLKDADGNPLSSQIFLETVNSCDQNLILLNFVENDAYLGNSLYLPLIRS